MNVIEIDTDPNGQALAALEELRNLIEDKTITEFAVAGVNLKGEVTTLVSPMGLPFAVIGGLAALQVKLSVKYVDSVRTEFAT